MGYHLADKLQIYQAICDSGFGHPCTTTPTPYPQTSCFTMNIHTKTRSVSYPSLPRRRSSGEFRKRNNFRLIGEPLYTLLVPLLLGLEPRCFISVIVWIKKKKAHTALEVLGYSLLLPSCRSCPGTTQLPASDTQVSLACRGFGAVTEHGSSE